MSDQFQVTFTINGQNRTVSTRPGETLLDVIRDDLGLTGTKEGCGLGDCGACTVLVDGRAVTSCIIMAIEVEGSEIITVEGLSRNGDLHPLQKSFVKHGALQCGFCTPGMLMSSIALLERNPDPSREEIIDALGGNLCRCGSYDRIVRAIQSWREYESTPLDTAPRPDDERDQERDLDVVSHGVTRYDGPDKATGRAIYMADIHLPGMVYGKILGSPIAHGLIRGIDTSRARALPGVLAVITGEDVPDTLYGVSPARYDEHVLAKERVRYVGDEVAAVVALDEDTAEQALALIDVEYEELPALFTPEEAMAADAPAIHPDVPRFAGNINTTVDWDFGDVEKGFEEADIILEERYIGNRTYQAPIEPHAAIARWEHHGPKLTLWSSTQVPHYLQHMVSRVFDIPMGDIRVIRPAVGGGFGVKAETTPLELCATIFARMTGRPVMMRYTREEMFIHFRGRHKQYLDLKIGAKKDGTITAVDSKVVLDGGAYTSFGVITAYYAGAMLPTLYKFDNYRYRGLRVFTNLPASGAMRGHGVPQPRFAFESLLDMIAEELSIDPIEIRLRNAMEPGILTCNDLDISSCEFTATLEQARDVSGWKDKKGKLPPGKGIGVGCGGFVSGAGYPIYRSNFPHSNAIIRVHEDGRAVSLHIAASEIGQGSDTVLPMIAAEELGIPYERVWMAECDSTLSPIDLGSYSSRVTLMAGNAVQMAAAEVKSRLLEVAGRHLDCDPGTLQIIDGRITPDPDSDIGLDWDEAARIAFSESGPLVSTGHYRPPEGLGGKAKGSAVGTSPAYSFSTAICEVSVDLETGYVTVEKFTDFSDAGTVINPVTFHGQVEGGITMGIGETLFEDTVFDEKGVLINPDLHAYLIPTIGDIPHIHSEAVESYEPRGPFGAKEIGEGCLLPILGAITNAIHDACGVRVNDLPITPEKILKGIRAQKGGGTG